MLRTKAAVLTMSVLKVCLDAMRHFLATVERQL